MKRLLASVLLALTAVFVVASPAVARDDRGPHRVCLIPEGCGHHGTRG